MLCAAPSRTFVAPAGPARDEGFLASIPRLRFVLPVLARSANFLELLLQEPAIDVELTSSVVLLDPGLAFNVLQLANPEAADENFLWQLSGALVAAGRERMLNLLECVPRISLESRSATGRKLLRLAQTAVARGCVARMLARELGGCHARKSFLTGLLFELPAMIKLACPDENGDEIRLQPWLQGSLPGRLTQGATEDLEGPACNQEALLATTRIAEALLRRETIGAPANAAGLDAWHPWPGLTMSRRHALLDRCCKLALWAEANVYRLHPWDFVSRLERQNPWE